MKITGLTDFQKDLLDVAQESPKAMRAVMGKVGNRAKTVVSKRAKMTVKKDTGLYHKRFKRGKVFIDKEGQIVTRVINSAPHAHLLEYGHKQVVHGKTVGFTPGKKVMEKGIAEFESSGDVDKYIGKALDDLLSKNKL